MGTAPVNALNFNSRTSGVLLHPTSFPGPYGVGDLGNSAYAFIDFLVASNQKLWQVLPLGPTGYGDSPYQAFSSFAGQPLIISPDGLIAMGLLSKSDLNVRDWDPQYIDYGPVIDYKTSLFKKAFENFDKTADKKLLLDYQWNINILSRW